MRTLHASNPKEVSTSPPIEVLLSEPAKRVLIFSGIAMPELRVNDDGKIYNDEVLVKLGVNVASLTHSVSHVGLASISNDETAFTFATDWGALEMEDGTGELQLRVQTGLRGEKTFLHRFGYQIVAEVEKVWAEISGTIVVPRSVFDMDGMAADAASQQFVITANTFTFVPPSGGTGFGSEDIQPVAWGHATAVRSDEANCYVDYVIDDCPFTVELHVLIATGGDLAAAAPDKSWVQIAGPNPCTLTNSDPTVDGVDFGMGAPVIVK